MNPVGNHARAGAPEGPWGRAISNGVNLLKEAFFRFARKQPLSQDRAAILMYHSVSDNWRYFFTVSPRQFEEQMRYLAQSGRPVVALSELVRRLKAGEPLGGAVALTFDDGYRDNYTTAFPILKRYGFPATIFVTTGMIDQTNTAGLPRLTSEEVKEMQATGLIDIQPHTKTHPKLSKLDAAAARVEIEGSKHAVEALLGKKANIFAYPFGNFNETVERTVGACGFDAAVTVFEGLVRPDTALLRLPRNSMDRLTSMAQFKGKISPTIDRYQKLKHLI